MSSMAWVLVIVAVTTRGVDVQYIPMQSNDACFKAGVSVAAMPYLSRTFCLNTEDGTVVG